MRSVVGAPFLRLWFPNASKGSPFLGRVKRRAEYAIPCPLLVFPPCGRAGTALPNPPFLYHPYPIHEPLSARGLLSVSLTYIQGGKTEIWARRRQGTPNPYRLIGWQSKTSLESPACRDQGRPVPGVPKRV